MKHPSWTYDEFLIQVYPVSGFAIINIKLYFAKIQGLTEKCDENDHQLEKLTREKVSYICVYHIYVNKYSKVRVIIIYL